MTIETEVANLTTQTTALLSAVNVSKATLDQKATVATEQAAIATTKAGESSASAATAIAKADAAEAARAAAVVAQNNAIAVVTGGTGSLASAPGKLPLADAEGKLDTSWFTSILPLFGPLMPQILFGYNEPGAFYDPSDMSTLFQDSAGTTPVTAVEQPVGRILDKSGRGNHASQATTTKRPVLSRRVNLLLGSEGGLSTYSAANNGTESAFPGYAGGVRLGLTSYLYKAVSSVQLNVAYKFSFFVRVDSGGPPTFANAGTAGVDANIILNNSYQGAPVTVVDIGGGTYSVSVTATIDNITGHNFFGLLRNTASREIVVTGYDLRLATDAHLPYQRVNTATDYDADPCKFPAYLRFDGVDDALLTGNIDFTGTDKMTVWAGITRFSDSETAVLAELGPNVSINNGSWVMLVPADSAPVMQFVSGGTISSGIGKVSNPAPETLRITGYGDISAPISGLRLNGSSTTSTSTQGEGSYGNYPLYIGARLGNLGFFNGRLYSLIVRGAQSTLPQIEATELYMKKKVGIA